MRNSFESRFTRAQNQREPYRIGTVVDCNPAAMTVDVRIVESEYLSSVPVMNLYGAAYARDLSWLQDLRGATVLLFFVGSQYFVLGTLPQQVLSSDTSTVSTIHEPGAGGAEALTYQRDISRNFHSGRPQDFLSGDKVLRTSSGALLGLFSEGAALLKASPMCQILLGRFKDFIRLIARRFQVYSDFGEVHLEHTEQGRVRASLHGGADFASETHPDQAKWTVQAWIGDDPQNPDSRVHVRVNDAANAEFVTLTLDILGNISVETSKDFVAAYGQDERSTVGRTREVAVAGDDSLTVGGEATREVTGSLTIKSDTAVVIKAPSISLN